MAGTFDTLPFLEQLGHVGAEIGRCVRWRQRDIAVSERARARALVFLERIAGDVRWGELERRETDAVRTVVEARDEACMAELEQELMARVCAARGSARP